jgi:hypothetical protein
MKMRIHLNFEAHLSECPECSFEQEFGGDTFTATCRSCDYHCGSELAEQWIQYVNQINLPAGVTITFAHEGEPDDYYLDVTLDRTILDPRAFTKWLKVVAANVDIEGADVAALLADGKQLSAQDEKLIDDLGDVLHEEGWGGREDNVPPAETTNVVRERLTWLRDMRAEGLR